MALEWPKVVTEYRHSSQDSAEWSGWIEFSLAGIGLTATFEGQYFQFRERSLSRFETRLDGPGHAFLIFDHEIGEFVYNYGSIQPMRFPDRDLAKAVCEVMNARVEGRKIN